MSDVAAFVERAWRDGVGPDDRLRLGRAIASATPVDGELALFAAWFDLLGELAVVVPPAPPSCTCAVLHAAAIVARARIARDATAMDAALARLGIALDEMEHESRPPGDAHGDSTRAVAARAWADLALGDVALAVDDQAAVRQRFEAICVPGRPVCLRITAMMRLVGVALSRTDPKPARTWARRALTLAESTGRPAQAARARILLAMLDYVTGNIAGVRSLLTPLLTDPEAGLLARMLLAGADDDVTAIELFADGLRAAVTAGDVPAYMMCVLVGSRRYATIGRRADALITLSAGIVELRKLAPAFAAILEDERTLWREQWGDDAFTRVEAEALASL